MENLIPPATLALIIGLTQAIKMAGLPSRFVPIVAIALGVCAIYLTEGVTGQTTILGITIGLFSVGLFSSGRALLALKKE